MPRVFGVPFAPDLVNITPGPGNYSVYLDNDEATTSRQVSVNGKLDYDLGFAHLASVTSYQDWKYNFTADTDLSNLNINGTATPITNPVMPGGGISNSGPYHSTEFTQELRLTSSGSGPLSYLVGAFYANAATSRDFVRGPVLVLAQWHGYQGTRSVAGFAGVDYKLSTGTTLSGAVRVNNERVQDFFVNQLPNATVQTSATALGTCGAGSTGCAGRNVDTAVTYKASIRQELAPQVSIYGSVASGYKGFAYDISSGYTPLRTFSPVQPERSTSYEIGLKSRFFDNHLQLNLTGFYTDYKNFQAQSSQLVNGALQNKLNNVGKLRTKGFELELSAKATDWLRFDGSAAYTDAKVVSFIDAACYAGQLADQALAGRAAGPEGVNFCGATPTAGLTGNFQDRSGSRLPNSPKFKFNIGATVERELGNDVKGLFTFNYVHQSGVSFDLLGNPLLRQDAYGVLNGAAAIETGHFKVTVFANNLFNKHYGSTFTDGFSTFGTHAVFQQLPRDSKRYFGIKIAAKY